MAKYYNTEKKLDIDDKSFLASQIYDLCSLATTAILYMLYAILYMFFYSKISPWQLDRYELCIVVKGGKLAYKIDLICSGIPERNTIFNSSVPS